MIYRDPKCVFVANNPGEADIVASWLNDHGIPSRVMNRATLGGLDGLTPFSPFGVATAGIEVWVQDPANAAEALRSLQEHATEQQTVDESEQVVDVTCDRCGQLTTIPTTQPGLAQRCQHCGAVLEPKSWEISQATEDEDEDVEDDDQAEPADRMAGLRSLRRPMAFLLLSPIFLGLGLLAVGLVAWLARAIFGL
jgi:hypothetical protein